MSSTSSIETLEGVVTSGFGEAAGNLAPVTGLIRDRTGLGPLHPGTLNVKLPGDIVLDADAEIPADQYRGWERLKLRRCTIGGIPAAIVRPETHESGNAHGASVIEIVAGVNLRDALALQEGDPVQVTLAPRRTVPSPEMPKKIILTNFQSPGDIVMLTAAVRDLHQCYPGRFLTDVRTPCPGLWESNPWITPLDEHDPDVEVIACEYPLIHRSNQEPVHFLWGFVEFLNERLGLRIRVTRFKGDIHIADQERHWFSQVEEQRGRNTPFWLITSGGKTDYTIKWWDHARAQQVVDHFRGRIEFVQVGQHDHHHPPLDGVIDLRGATDLRQLVRLVYHAQGVVCAVSLLMHLAAAVEGPPGSPPNRPCVVVAGGREPTHWEAYPHHQFLHTIGALRCCDNGGCWKARTLPLGDGDEKDEPDHLCVDVVGTLPRCMDMITADHVIQSIDLYLQGGIVRDVRSSG